MRFGALPGQPSWAGDARAASILCDVTLLRSGRSSLEAASQSAEARRMIARLAVPALPADIGKAYKAQGISRHIASAVAQAKLWALRLPRDKEVAYGAVFAHSGGESTQRAPHIRGRRRLGVLLT